MPPQSSLRNRLREILPAICLISILNMLSGQLDRYGPIFSISTTASFYVWASIWMATFLVSLQCTDKTGSSMVAGTGWARNFIILQEMYGLLGGKSACEEVGMVEFGVAVGCSVVAGGGSYFVNEWFYRGRERVGDDGTIAAAVRCGDSHGDDDVEKVLSR